MDDGRVWLGRPDLERAVRTGDALEFLEAPHVEQRIGTHLASVELHHEVGAAGEDVTVGRLCQERARLADRAGFQVARIRHARIASMILV
jgi:hypothetical protein